MVGNAESFRISEVELFETSFEPKMSNPNLDNLEEGNTTQKDIEVSPTQSRMSPSMQRILRPKLRNLEDSKAKADKIGLNSSVRLAASSKSH